MAESEQQIRMRAKYHLTSGQAAQIYADQDGRCVVCGEWHPGHGSLWPAMAIYALGE